MKTERKIYHLQFDEWDNYDDPMNHNVFIEANNKINIDLLFEEVDVIKGKMDNCDDYDDDYEEDTDSEYAEYSDCGWDEKIDYAVELVIKNHPEWEVKILNIETFSTEIN